MTKKLFFEAMLKHFSGVVLLGLLLFLPAGTLSYWNAWLLMGILFIPMLLAGILMMFKNPDLLRKRLNAKEEEGEQRLVIILSGLMFVLGFVIAGLSFRYQWPMLPNWASWVATVAFCSPMCSSGKSCGKTPISPAPSKCRKIKRSLIPVCTGSFAIRCTV